jgi:hypothetical protein
MKVINIFRSVYRLIPAFGLVTILSVSAAFLFKVPQSRLVTVVIVPLSIGFLLSRIVVILLPRTLPDEGQMNGMLPVPPAAFLGLNLLWMSVSAVIISGFSAAAFHVIDLQVSSIHALSVMFYSCVVAAAAFALVSVIAVFDIRKRLGSTRRADPLKTVAAAEVATLWNVARSPSAMAKFMPGGNHVAHC